jgi:hypothetical protein
MNRFVEIIPPFLLLVGLAVTLLMIGLETARANKNHRKSLEKMLLGSSGMWSRETDKGTIVVIPDDKTS